MILLNCSQAFSLPIDLWHIPVTDHKLKCGKSSDKALVTRSQAGKAGDRALVTGL